VRDSSAPAANMAESKNWSVLSGKIPLSNDNTFRQVITEKAAGERVNGPKCRLNAGDLEGPMLHVTPLIRERTGNRNQLTGVRRPQHV